MASNAEIGRPGLRWPAGLLLALVSALVNVACTSAGGDDVIAGSGELGHIHDLVFSEDGDLLVASHTGLWRIDGLDRAVLVGSERHDLMSMTSLPDGTLIASGHPDLRLDQYRLEDRPALLGLVRSDDRGESWEVVDLLGVADFHALAATATQVFGAESGGQVWHLDTDEPWSQLGAIDAHDLALDPAGPARQLAVRGDGTVWVTTDGAMTWSRIDGAPSMIEVEWPSEQTVLGVSEDGQIWAGTPTGIWRSAGAGPPGVETFHVDSGGMWWLTAHGGSIHRSDDEGETWVDVYQPPPRS